MSNHLLQIVHAEIFAKASKNGLLQTQPGVIHFDGYTVGKVHYQTLVSKHQHNSTPCNFGSP